MTKFSNYKVKNYNMSYEILLDAIVEFDSFITGTGTNHDYFKKFLSTQTNSENAADHQKYKRIRKSVTNNISKRILDRTTGTYFLKDLMLNWSQIVKPDLKENDTKPKATSRFVNRFFEVHYENSSFTTRKLGNDILTNDRDVYNDDYADSTGKNSEVSIKHVITHIDPSKSLTLKVTPETRKKGKTDQKKSKLYEKNNEMEFNYQRSS